MKIELMLRSKIVAESYQEKLPRRRELSDRRPFDGDEGEDEDDSNLRDNGVYGSNGFFFQQRTLPLNLRLLSQLDIDRVVRDVDIECLQRHIEQITFCSLREEELKYVTDQQVIKLFRVAQLIIEYLLHSQDKLIKNMDKLASKYVAKKR